MLFTCVLTERLCPSMGTRAPHAAGPVNDAGTQASTCRAQTWAGSTPGLGSAPGPRPHCVHPEQEEPLQPASRAPWRCTRGWGFRGRPPPRLHTVAPSGRRQVAARKDLSPAEISSRDEILQDLDGRRDPGPLPADSHPHSRARRRGAGAAGLHTSRQPLAPPARCSAGGRATELWV